MMLSKCYTQSVSRLGKLTGLEKVSFHSSPKEGQYQRMFNIPYNCFHFSSRKIILNILEAKLQQYMNQEL